MEGVKYSQEYGGGKGAEEREKAVPKPVTPPTLLITAVTGKTSALPNAAVEYNVTIEEVEMLEYNHPEVEFNVKILLNYR